MFQYDSGQVGPGTAVKPIIKDFGRTEEQIGAFFEQSQRDLKFAWSADGVRVAVDARNQDAVPTLATTGDALTDNTILAGGRLPRQVSAALFNSLRAGGYFVDPADSGWQVKRSKRLSGDQPYLNVAVLCVPTHDFSSWGKVPTAERLTVLNTALRIAFTTWSADYRADSVYAFAAPEYYFGGVNSHFLADADATDVTTGLTSSLQLLPDNFLVVPGSVGRRRQLNGQAAVDFYQRSLKAHAALLEEMRANGLSQGEFRAQQAMWDREPKLDKDTRDRAVYVYSNTATVFRGKAAPTTQAKRYESDSEGGSPDRSLAESDDGYFDIGTSRFAVVINGLTIRLEICSDNAYESIKSSGYDGLHILIASDFGEVEPSTQHGQYYANVDSKLDRAYVSVQKTPAVAKNREEAGGREFDTIAPHLRATITVGSAQCRLTLHQVPWSAA